MMKKWLKVEWVSQFVDTSLPMVAALGAFALGAIMLLFFNVNPLTAYGALINGAFGSWNSIAETLVKATPEKLGLMMAGVKEEG